MAWVKYRSPDEALPFASSGSGESLCLLSLRLGYLPFVYIQTGDLLIRLGLRFCIDKWLLIRLELRRCIYTVTWAFRPFRPELLRVSGSAPRHAIRAQLLMRGGPLLYIHLFVDSVGVTVLYRQMAIDSVGVMALYIHGDLCFPSGFAVSFCGFRVRRPGMRFEP